MLRQVLQANVRLEFEGGGSVGSGIYSSDVRIFGVYEQRSAGFKCEGVLSRDFAHSSKTEIEIGQSIRAGMGGAKPASW